MITDVLENLGKYRSVIPHSKEILDYIKATSLSSLQAGKYPVIGDSAFILIQEYLTKTESEKKWESHKKYIDIQIVLDGLEFMDYSPSSVLSIQDPYSEEKDIVFYKNDAMEHSRIVVPKNHFCIFFPGEAHKPGLHVTREMSIMKAVIKVAIG
jgi:YhcH/YjgK/YiaL family protein